MTGEGFCNRHGPYDASLGRCPYCAREGGLPPEPPPLDDDLPTDPWGGRERRHGFADDEEVTDPRGGGRAWEEENDEITDLPMRRRSARDEDDDMTEFPQRRGDSRGGWEEDETVVERVETGLLGFLIVKEGARRGQVHRIRHGTTIGRGEAKILIRDPKISRFHAKFTVEEGQFYVWDFGSENGTLVNGSRIREATPLQENDLIRVGDTAFVLKTLE